MKTRSLLLILSLVSLLAVGGGGVSLYFYLNSAVSSEAKQQTEIITSQLSNLIFSYLKQRRNISAALAGAKQLKEALEENRTKPSASANTLLDNYCSSLKASVCYLMNINGNTIASSNRNSPASFVGKNYSFRPYFKQALVGENAIYMALGVTSRKRGIYFSSPVVLADNNIAGVVVTKYSVKELESKLSNLPGIASIVDPNDVIFASGRSEWLFQNIGGKLNRPVAGNGDAMYLVSERKIDNLTGWKLTYWLSTTDTATFLPKEVRRLSYAFGILFIFTVAFIFSLYMISIRDVRKRTLTHETLLKSEKKYRQIVETTHAISWELDLATWRFTYVSPHAFDIFAYPLEEWLTENFWPEHLHPDDHDQALSYCIEKTKKGEDHNFEYRMIAADGSVVWLRDMVTVDSSAGERGGLRGTMVDITEIKQAEEKVKTSLAEKEVLLQEIHHRVKNNLQVVSSMLSLQANTEKDSKTAAALLEGERRVRVMARVHENLYQSDDLSSVNTAKYIEGIVNDLRYNYQDRMKDVSIRIEADDVTFKMDQAIPLGQIGSELVSNAFKHAFPDGRSGVIEVLFKRDNNRLVFSVADNGIGMPDEMKLNTNKSLGLQLVNALAQKLDGEVTVERDNGTRVSIVFNGECA